MSLQRKKIGKGYLAITFDQPEPRGRNQGIVPLEGASLTEAVQNYFRQSEQLPTLIRVSVDDSEGKTVAGGLLVQHLADGEEGKERLHVRMDHPEWEHVQALAGSISDAELLDGALPLEEIVWRLFHEEEQVRIEEGSGLKKGCRCDPDHIRGVIARFPADEREEMADKDGNIAVNCEFCSRSFPISLSSLNN